MRPRKELTSARQIQAYVAMYHTVAVTVERMRPRKDTSARQIQEYVATIP
jgi:hypothetical protein